ncbi:MAG: hypothetical protein BWY58_00068 [Chloroflexi bacterium ADurb.Bin344]|nr:MAG: hypothetical protein BWY58_00068 [Chloroflexi bacterium ADurb.Bin344]
MGFRLFRRIGIAPGVTFNLSKTGGSFSFGIRGARITLGRTGIRKTVGIPGTGLYYTTHESWQATKQKFVPTSQAIKNDLLPYDEKLKIPWHRYIFLSGDMKKFGEAIQAFYSGRPNYARALLQKIQYLPDAQFMLAIAWLNEKEYTNASVIIENIINQRFLIGKQLEQLRIQLTVGLEIEAGWGIELPGSQTGVIIAGARSRQQLQRETEALDLLFSDPKVQEMSEVQLLMADIYISASDKSPSGNRTALEEAIRIVCAVENRNDKLVSVCHYYNAKAIRRLGYFDQAERILLNLLNTDQLDTLYVKYELARMYEDAGNTRQARIIYQEIYTSAPDFLDVHQRMILEGSE